MCKSSSFIATLLVAGCLCSFSSCEKRPSLVEQRKAELRGSDSVSLAEAKADSVYADSLATFREFELQELKQQFVFEKQEKYQTAGYYVLPSYAGSKTGFTFFPEVEESGKLLLVFIDGKRRYSFTEIDLSNEDISQQVSHPLTPRQMNDVHRCLVLAKTMQDLKDAQRLLEKAQLKIRFYEKKLSMRE